MKRKRYSRKDLGNGSYCYAGPHCKLHGVPVNTTSILEEVAHYQSLARTKFHALIHEDSVDVQQLEDLGEDALLSGRQAYHCPEHNLYHVYSVQTGILSKVKDISGFHLREVGSYIKNGILTKADANEFRQQISAIIKESNVDAEYQAHKTLMKEFQEAYKNSPEAEKALQAREKQLLLARTTSVRVKVEKTNAPAQVDEKKVPDATILEYWQCGRKRQFVSAEDGWKKIRSLREEEVMEPYQCSHCPEWHIGHGFGKDSIESQLERGRIHWMENGDKSNVFAFRKGILK